MRCVRVLCILVLLLALDWESVAQDVCVYKFSNVDKVNFDKGVKAYNDKHYTEATALLRKVSSKNPKAAEPYFYLGMMAVRQDVNPAAIRRYFTKLVELCPDHPNALTHFYKGVIDYTDERYEEAVADFNRYFEIANRQSIPEYVKVYEEASNYLYWSQFLADAAQNTVPFNPNVVRGASSKNDEILPFVTWNGQEIYYLRQVPQRKEKTYYGKMYEQLEPRLCVSRRKDSVFTSGEELTDPFNQGASEGGVSISADNNLLYYSVLAMEKGVGNYDIFFSERKNGVWQPVQNAGRNVNSPKSWDSQPSITPDGQYLYFASNREGGYGGTDIWVCHRLPNGDWSRAENLGPAVNTGGNEKCPFIHADGRTLYFASNGWQGFGGYDMYFINLKDTYMQRPTNMGMPINGEGDEFGFGIVADGKKGYFANKSVDYNGVGGTDIFWFDLYPDARPESMRWLPVRLDSVVDCKISVASANFSSEYLAHGLSSGIMVSLEEDNVVAVKAKGCLPYVLVVSHRSANTIKELNGACRQSLNDATPFPQLFETGKGVRISQSGAMALDCYCDFLMEHPMMHVCVEHPKESHAKAIYDYMLDKKIRAERITYKAVQGNADGMFRVTKNE